MRPRCRNDSDPLSETLSESIRNCLNIEMLMSVDITIGGARVVSTVSEGSLSDLAELPSPPAQDPAAQKEALAEALVCNPPFKRAVPKSASPLRVKKK